MDILNKARKLESTLARTLDHAVQQWARSGAREPLEVRHAVVDAVVARLEPAGRGKHVFPFNRIRVFVAAGSRDARARFAAVIDGDPSLRELVTARLREAGCDPDLHIKTTYVGRPEPHWGGADFHIEFDRMAAAELPPPERFSGPDNIELTISHGSAEEPSYTFTLPRINIGRCGEVRDSRNRLIRTNHVAFADGTADSNQSVSRHHAHIDYAADSRDYRVCDDRSAQGTALLRNGKTIVVPSGSRGIRLQTGDEIILGEARVCVRITRLPQPEA